jgi:hypothetical protein
MLGSVRLQQDEIEAGECSDWLRSLAFFYGDTLTSLYVCNTTGCNSHAALMLLPPASPRPSFIVSSSFMLQGYSVSTFGAAQRAQFTGVLAEQLNVVPAKVNIVSVTASSAPLSSRRLLQNGVVVAFTVETLTPESISASLVRVAASSGFLAALRQGGLSAVTGVVVTAAPTAMQVQSTASVVNKAQPSNALAGLAALIVLLPVVAWLRRRHSRADSDAAAAVAVEQLPERGMPPQPHLVWGASPEAETDARNQARTERLAAQELARWRRYEKAGQHVPPPLQQFNASQAPTGARAAAVLAVAHEPC